MITPLCWLLNRWLGIWLQVLLCTATIFFGYALPAKASAPEWRVLETPRFRVVSQLKEKETRAWADEFNQFIDALTAALGTNEQLLPPLSVVLFARERDFRPYLPSQPNGKPWKVAGYFARQETWASIGLAGRLDDVETRRTIFHEGVHWIVSAYPRYLPLCINEGLAEVYSTFTVENGRPQWGKPIDLHVGYLNYGGNALIPIEQLLLTTSSNSLFNEEERVGVFYAESWAFVHYLMFGEHKGVRSSLDEFLQAYSTGSNTEDAFRKAFGVDFTTMDRQLRAYLHVGRYTLYSNRSPLANKAPEPFPTASAEVVEIALAKLALGSGHIDLARIHAAAAVKLAPTNPAAYDALACVEAERNGHEVPVGTLEKAVELGSKDAWTYTLLAIGRAQAALDLGGIPPAEARRIADLLEHAVVLRPNLLTAYKRLSSVLLEVDKITKQDALVVMQGIKIFPDEGTLVFGFAQLAWKSGEKKDARKLLARALARPGKMEPQELAFARSTETRWLYEEISEQMRALTDVGRFQEALEALDGALHDERLPGPVKSELASNRDRLAAFAKWQNAREALGDNRREEARRLLRELIAEPSAPAELKREAAEMLNRPNS